LDAPQNLWMAVTVRPHTVNKIRAGQVQHILTDRLRFMVQQAIRIITQQFTNPVYRQFLVRGCGNRHQIVLSLFVQLLGSVFQ
jgi:hypothetical protein